MTRRLQFLTGAIGAAMFAAGAAIADGNAGSGDARFCMEVDLGPFHMVPGFMTDPGACAVRDYWDGWLRDTFYPFTLEDHLFNCEVFGDVAPLPTEEELWVPSSVVSEGDTPGTMGEISGTIGGHPFSATLYCASLTNWYERFCDDPSDPDAPCFQLSQPFFDLTDEDPYSRVSEVSVFDGVITVDKGKNGTAEVPIVMATRAAGITHLESLVPYEEQVGASVTHSLLGMVTYEADDGEVDVDDVEVLSGSLDVLLQGHIFFPDTVGNDPKAARVRGALCSKDLHKLLNKKGKKGGHEDDD